jgi:glucosamine-6-phosphate deaminase
LAREAFNHAMSLLDLMKIPADRLGGGTDVNVRIVPDADQLILAMATDMADAIRMSSRSGRPVSLIVPVGPVGQYEPLARMIAHENLRCSSVTFINMDEFVDDDARWIDPAHPLSFRGFMDRSFYGKLPESADFHPENRIFPDPADPEAIDRAIDERGGVAVCFGGIGLNGHIAFNEPEDGVSVEEFARRSARCLALAPASRAHMAVNLSCALDLIPQRAITIGMKQILAARAIRLYANRPWQRGVVRQVLHGPITPACPASYIRSHADAAIVMSRYVSEAPEVCLR